MGDGEFVRGGEWGDGKGEILSRCALIEVDLIILKSRLD